MYIKTMLLDELKNEKIWAFFVYKNKHMLWVDTDTILQNDTGIKQSSILREIITSAPEKMVFMNPPVHEFVVIYANKIKQLLSKMPITHRVIRMTFEEQMSEVTYCLFEKRDTIFYMNWRLLMYVLAKALRHQPVTYVHIDDCDIEDEYSMERRLEETEFTNLLLYLISERCTAKEQKMLVHATSLEDVPVSLRQKLRRALTRYTKNTEYYNEEEINDVKTDVGKRISERKA